MKQFPIDEPREIGEEKVEVPSNILNKLQYQENVIEIKEEIIIGENILEAGDKIKVLEKAPQIAGPNKELMDRKKKAEGILSSLLRDIERKTDYQRQASSIKRMIKNLEGMSFR